jgi:hypothetical protein
MRKTYKVRVAFGDGKPVEATITAKNGLEACDLARVEHPGARNVHLLGLATNQLEDVHPFFSSSSSTTTVIHTREEEECERKLRWCLELRTQGKTHLQIAQLLGIGKTTVGRWIKQYG